MERLGKGIVLAGLLIVVIGIVVWLFGNKFRFLGRLPGDLRYERGNVHIYIPITTMILFSVIFSLLIWIIQRLLR